MFPDAVDANADDWVVIDEYEELDACCIAASKSHQDSALTNLIWRIHGLSVDLPSLPAIQQQLLAAAARVRASFTSPSPRPAVTTSSMLGNDVSDVSARQQQGHEGPWFQQQQ